MPAEIGPLAENMTVKPMVPSTRFRTMPVRLQIIRVDIRSQPSRIRTTMITGRTRSTRAGRVEPSRSMAEGTPELLLRPMTTKRTAETAAETAA